MTYQRDYRKMTIIVEAYWSEASQSNLYKWHILSQPLETELTFRDFNECYYDACAVIDEWLSQFEK